MVLRRPFTLVLAATIEVLYGLALAGAGIFWLVMTTQGHSEDLLASLGTVVFALGAGVALCLAGWGLFALRTWARTPVVLTQLFGLGIAWYQLMAPPYAPGVILGLGSAVALATVLTPATTAALFPDEEADEPGAATSSGSSGSSGRGAR